MILGDNLGLNSVLGFIESFNANFYCRLCKTHKDDAQCEIVENNLRVDSYDQDVVEPNVSESGIKEKCIWNKVEHFGADTNYCVDWLHDGPEGWFKHLMGLILHYFTKDHLPKKERLSLKTLNSRINNFQYRVNGLSNKPPYITLYEVARKELKMSGNEMQTFMIIFPMLVGDLIPKNNDVWRLYLHMRKIMDIVLMQSLHKKYQNLLNTLVSVHLLLFKKVFPDERIKCKSHNVLHYGTVLLQSGPIINTSTVRFEGYHKHKKQEAAATTSRKKNTKTLTTKESFSLCYRLMLQ